MMKNKSDNQMEKAGAPAEQDQGSKIGLKPQREEESDAKKEARWQKVSAIFEEAHKAYTGGAGFGEVVASLIKTLMNLGKSEMPHAMGGLGINDGPQMDLPAQEPPADEAVQQEQ